MASPTVRVEPSGIVFETEPGEAVMHAAVRQGYRWPTLCHGEGSCTICHFEVIGEAAGLAPPSSKESDALRSCGASRWCAGELRLACQARVLGDVVVRKKGVRPSDAPKEVKP